MTALRLTLVLLLAFFASFSSLKGQTQADATTGLNGLAGMPMAIDIGSRPVSRDAPDSGMAAYPSLNILTLYYDRISPELTIFSSCFLSTTVSENKTVLISGQSIGCSVVPTTNFDF